MLRAATSATLLGGAIADAPVSFDCSVRKLAYTYGKQLLPRQGAFESLFYALGLNEDSCSAALSADQEPLPASSGLPKDAIFVADWGADSNAGSKHAPLRTIHAALKAAAGATGPATIVLRDGVHYLEETAILGPEHSGLTVRAMPGEKPVVSGGKKLDVSWKLHSEVGDGAIYKTNVLKQVATVPGLQLDGIRATRARYPNLPAGIEVSPGYGELIKGNSATWTPPDFDKFGKVTYYTDNVTEHTRDTAVDGWYNHYAVGIGGLCSVYDPPVGYWCSENTKGGGAFAFRTPSGVAASTRVLPNSPYSDVSQMIVNVWRPKRWANWMFEVAEYDPATNNFTFGAGGHQGARGENVGGDFFLENVLEELDYPGEFFHNETTGELFLYYNGTGAPPSDMEVVAPQLRTLVNITGTQWNPVRDVTIDGVTFKSARYTYMDPHGVPSAGDWSLDRIAAVFLQGTEAVSVQNSTFERLDGNAVMISGYNRNATVQSCDFAFIGGNAIVSWGYTNETENSGYPYYTPRTNFPMAGVDGTDGNHPRYTKIFGNSGREIGLYEKQSSFYMQAKTAETLISGNVFFNGPRAGINFNDGFGGGDELSHNLVFSACRESGDHGPFNSWDRQPYLTTVRTGEPSTQMAWRNIHHNFLLDNYSPQEGVDNDDGSAYYNTHDNFLVYGLQGLKSDFGGHDNHHTNNIYAYVNRALWSHTHTLSGHENRFNANKVFMTGVEVGKNMFTNMSNNEYYTPNGTVVENGMSLADWQALGNDQGSIAAVMPDDDVILALGVEKLGIHVPTGVVFA